MKFRNSSASLSTVLAILAAVVLTSAAFAAPGFPATQLVVDVPAIQLHSAATPPLRLAERAGTLPLAELPAAVDVAQTSLAEIRAWNQAGRTPARNGFPRAFAESQAVRFEAGLASRSLGEHDGGVLDRLGETLVWGGEVRVADAWRVRLRLSDVQLPAGTLMWVYNDTETVGPFGLELRNAARELWTPSVGGGVVRLEVRLPAGAQLDEASQGFTLDRVMELFRLDADGAPMTRGSFVPRIGDCIIDSQCNTEIDLDPFTRDAMQQAIGLISFIDGGASICSGGLLNDVDPGTTIPWFLTANHCFNNQAAATTAEVFWDYYTASCNGAAPNIGGLPRSMGATLISTNQDNDHTLIQLNSIPNNRALLGWNADPADVPNNTTLYRFSHPFGEPQRYSRNHVDTGFPECLGGPRPDFLYEFFSPSQGDKGGTFGGSSGAPLLLPAGQTVGQLTGGCPDGNSDPFDGCDYGNAEVDGAFSSTFDDIGPFLTGTGGCVPGPTTLCLVDGRFQVELAWRAANTGPFADANVVQGVSSDNSGLFYFNNVNNWEMLVKVLNGCNGQNNHYWVFFAATTDVNFELTVTDTQAGVPPKVYTNPFKQAADAVTDTSAFATCP